MHCARTVQKFTRRSIATNFRIWAYTFWVDPSAEFLSELGTIKFMLFSSMCPNQIRIRPRCHHVICMPVLYIIVAIRNVTHDTPCLKRCAIENLIVCHTATLFGPPSTGTAQIVHQPTQTKLSIIMQAIWYWWHTQMPLTLFSPNTTVASKGIITLQTACSIILRIPPLQWPYFKRMQDPKNRCFLLSWIRNRWHFRKLTECNTT